ncbi:MAG TPA: tail fiber domain-containing protein, partial [Ferruginibacter sp.]|nr:tail fiber domain-containing protein [Ferruginibacter sp.]
TSTTGSYNTALGVSALNQNNSSHNVAIGNGSLYWTLTGGNFNTAIGDSSGFWGNNNTYCTYVGMAAKNTLNTGYNNSTAIGWDARVTGSSQIILGNSLITSLRCAVTTITAISDGRFKNNVAEKVPGLTFINKLRPVTYNLDIRKLNTFLHAGASAQDDKAINTKERIVESGFIAQEVESAAKSIGYDFNGVDKPQNANDTYGLRYASFVVPLVKAVQELDAKNAQLEKENDLLKKTLEQLQQDVQAIKTGLKHNK